MSSLGNSVNTATNAINIASPVSKPKIMVGIKFDSTSIEKPKIMVIPVKNIALPMLSCDRYTDSL